MQCLSDVGPHLYSEVFFGDCKLMYFYFKNSRSNFKSALDSNCNGNEAVVKTMPCVYFFSWTVFIPGQKKFKQKLEYSQ